MYIIMLIIIVLANFNYCNACFILFNAIFFNCVRVCVYIAGGGAGADRQTDK